MTFKPIIKYLQESFLIQQPFTSSFIVCLFFVAFYSVWLDGISGIILGIVFSILLRSPKKS